MSKCVLGVDTSNYTTSLALYEADSGKMIMERRLLPVESGQLGLRQSDAVFAHIKQLPGLMERLRGQCSEEIEAVGVSVRPRDIEGSYMPCFLVGQSAASVAASSLNVPLYEYSHQAGHLAAAIYGADRLRLFEEDFLAFHVSGGTTDCVYVKPHQDGFQIAPVCGSSDLKAGQAVDRVGKMLGLSFPAGPALEALALEYKGECTYRVSAKEGNVSLSGLENKCAQKLASGGSFPEVAKLCLTGILNALMHMTKWGRTVYGQIPVLYAGGVMSNLFLQESLGQLPNTYFSDPTYCGDNAAGVAILASRRLHRERSGL